MRKAEAKLTRALSNVDFGRAGVSRQPTWRPGLMWRPVWKGAAIRARSILQAAAEDQRRDIMARTRSQQAAWRPGSRQPFVSRGAAVRSE